jgi:arylsulfatase
MKNLLPTLAVAALFAACATTPKSPQQERADAIEAHEKAVHIKEDGWIRDPYIVLGPDRNYYLTGTTRNPLADADGNRYNTGLGDSTVVGDHLRVWRSEDMLSWEELPSGYSVSGQRDIIEPDTTDKDPRLLLWAPELHWDAANSRWVMVHCPRWASTLAMTSGLDISAPWTHPSPKGFFRKHDPSLFLDDDGTWYLVWGNTLVAPIKPDFSGLAGEPVSIDPADRKIGHEGTLIRKIGDKYVHFGTAWSTDKGRHGSYNLYYCTSDKVTGPYSERRFVGRFLGHGTPFQDKSGNWWCTAFYNANVPPLPREGIQTRDLSETAQTINPQGTTIVPLTVEILPDGDIYIRAIDPDYATPGPDEVWPVPDMKNK